MKCPNPQCSVENPETNRYCGACGTALDIQNQSVAKFVSTTVISEVRAAVAASLKDRKVVEVEIAESITGRLIGWAKVFGLFAGVPLALLLITLALLGVSNYADFRKKLTDASPKRL